MDAAQLVRPGGFALTGGEQVDVSFILAQSTRCRAARGGRPPAWPFQGNLTVWHPPHRMPPNSARWKASLRQRTAWPVLALLTLAGCETTADGAPSTQGDLSRVEFEYDCTWAEDQACLDRGPDYDGPFPERVGVGAFFGLSADGLQIIPPETDVVTVEMGAFMINEPGQQVFLAVGANTVVSDILHILASVPEEIRLTDEADAVVSDELLLEVGQDVTLTATTYDAQGALLAGAPSLRWTSSAPEIVDATSTQGASRAMFRASALGDAILTVETGGTTRELNVRVGDGTDTTGTGSDTEDCTCLDGCELLGLCCSEDICDPEETDSDTDTDSGGSTGGTGQ